MEILDASTNRLFDCAAPKFASSGTFQSAGAIMKIRSSTGTTLSIRVNLYGGLTMIRILIATMVFLFTMNSSATTLMFKNLDSLVEADAVVVGTVENVASDIGPDEEIYTFVTLDNLELIKGAYARSTLTLRLKGGDVAGQVTEVIGSPHFACSERVLLFVRGNGERIVPLVGWTQGVFRFVPDSAGDFAVRDHDGNRVLKIEDSVVVKDQEQPSAANIVGESTLDAASGQIHPGPRPSGTSPPRHPKGRPCDPLHSSKT